MQGNNFPNWEAFRNGRLELDCRVIEIKPNDPNQMSYSGPGQIYQDDDRRLRIKCYCPESSAKSLSHTLRRTSRVKAGQLFDRNDFFSITAVTFDGQIWECKDVLVRPTHYLQAGGDIVTASVSDLTTTLTNKGATGSSLLLLIPNQPVKEWDGLIGVDWNIGAPYTGYRVQISSPSETEILVSISTSGSFPDDFHVRVMEALRYLSGRVLSLSLMQRRDGETTATKLYSTALVHQKRPFPPLDTRYMQNAPGMARLFERYLAFASSHNVQEFWHPCSA